MDEFKCTEEDCSGLIIVSSDNAAVMRTGCHSCDTAYPCNTCGRLHWDDRTPLNNRDGDAAFLIDGRQGVRGKDGEIVFY